MIAVRWVLLVALVACAKKEEAPPQREAPQLPAHEIKLAQDACGAYVRTVCGCADTEPAAKELCAEAKPLAEAVELAAQLANAPNPEARKDALHGADAVRKTTKTCLERMAKAPPTCPVRL